MRAPLALSLSALTLASVLGCQELALRCDDSGMSCEGGEDCTEMGCVGGLTVNFEISEQGVWTFEIDILDGNTITETITCSSTLPLDDASAADCDRADVFVMESGSALEDSQHQLMGIMTDDFTPESLDIRVYKDGEERASESFVPAYSSYSPNGEACGPTCYSAIVSMDIE